MIPFASLADKNMADKIATEIKKHGIFIEVSRLSDEYVLSVLKEEDVEQATDIYRVMLGLPKQFKPSKEWTEIQAIPMGLTTKVVILFCVIVYALDAFKIMPELYSVMKISENANFELAEIRNGQVWRLVTPIFLHFGFMHILFNLMWMKDLGKIIEREKSSNFLLVFIVIIGTLSNFSQFLISGPNFGGMSGVVYGLLGYLWMYKRINKEAEFSLPKSDVMLMIGWFFLCLVGVFVFAIANMAHAVGLTLGMLLGIFYGARDSKESTSIRDIGLFSLLAFALPLITWVVEIIRIK
ncbi:rhomboid family intramembrane serine protease [Halobacteriovorax sp. JY17]|uniref:rhomboid family intramembrane serine protease n=1 Tax=Halobacteriovorax sp. JY17 TaxID=2014617 RepID=UPI000C42B9DA|nr:rhomboid family intramembrane serine protease [Halobacteriovorax sp. JY17]PIK15283.1 MAG: hypothetical protein CES88_00810 [Halobacteriovorax sp. JY17]